LLLVVRRSRWLAIGLAVAFHGSIELSMMVSTFGATMLLLLVCFSPTWVRVPPMKGVEKPATETADRVD
ncbi:MAG: hypothetical protein GWN07_01985, partial [Actinobacteria bacterium]|nr:hypothetical protein [Actinomycetota bacterium]NIW26105.1 hypothetical protein [Actinomycetota bacterium]NIX18675.1 hypothetical protein [Actinomycetota bacterium]